MGAALGIALQWHFLTVREGSVPSGYKEPWLHSSATGLLGNLGHVTSLLYLSFFLRFTDEKHFISARYPRKLERLE